MGLLATGTPLSWHDSQQYIEYVKEHGLAQFLRLYKEQAHRTDDAFRWGDELEYIIISMKDGNITLPLISADILATLESEFIALGDDSLRKVTFHPEYARYMIEATPGFPYENFTSDLRLVEHNMRLRRELIYRKLTPDQHLLSLCSYPMLGVGEFCDPFNGVLGEVANSEFVPDMVTNPHPRFPCLTKNIRTRRGSNVNITMPRFQDTHTAERFPLETSTNPRKDTKDTIYMDAMAFGMGCCCLQVTFQAVNITEARHLYDQLGVLTPIMMSLSASTPFLKGQISDNDVRWSVIAQSVDDRTPGERGESALLPGEQRINKSRYDSISTYISQDKTFHSGYNDVDIAINQKAYSTLLANGIDDVLARHIAHLFVRDPLVIFMETLEQDDATMTDHFENIQSTNWQSVRFKPPPAGSDIGWRVEFRSMEVQFTDFENAAFTVFVALISRAILLFELNLYIPISKLDENMDRAHKMGAVLNQKFFFRKYLKVCMEDDFAEPNAIVELTVSQILSGCCEFVGLIPIVQAYLDCIRCDPESRLVINRYLELLERRASGDLQTPATWMREFVTKHPSYKKDSVVPEEACKDLMKRIIDISDCSKTEPTLLGNLCNCDDPVKPVQPPMEERRELLSRYIPDDFVQEERSHCRVLQEILESARRKRQGLH